VRAFAAAVMERIGMRRMMIGSLLFLAVGVSLTTLMHAVWQLYLLWGVVVGLGSGAITGWVAATVANRWFVERRGLVVGLLTASTATGQLLFLPLLAKLAVTAGWRPAVLLVAGVTLLVIPLVALFVRNRPQDVGLRPYGAPDVSPDLPASHAGAARNPFGVAVAALVDGARSRDFLLLAGSFFICGGLDQWADRHPSDPGIRRARHSEVTAASLLAVIGVFDIFGTMFSGWLSDRFDSRWLLCWYYSFRGLSLLFLPYAYGTGFFGLALFVVFYGLDWVATVPPTVRITATASASRMSAPTTPGSLRHISWARPLQPSARCAPDVAWRLSGELYDSRRALPDCRRASDPHRPLCTGELVPVQSPAA